MRCAVKYCVFIEIYGEFETFSTSSAPSGHLLLKEKALVCTNLKQLDKSEFNGLWNEITIDDEIHPSAIGADFIPVGAKGPHRGCGGALG